MRIKTRWLQIRRGHKHAVMRQHGTEVEFWCGKGRQVSELALPTIKARACRQCMQYLRNMKYLRNVGTDVFKP